MRRRREPASEEQASAGTGRLLIAVVVSRFPKFTETFVVNEVLAFERMGLAVEVDPLLPEEKGPHQPAARSIEARVHFGNPWGRTALLALLRALRGQPATVAGIVTRLLRDTWRHPPFLIKDLVLLPRICVLADGMRARGVTHVHAHFATHAGFAAWALGRLTGLPYSIVAHGSDVHRNRWMMRTKFAEAAFVATVSEFNRNVIVEECGSDIASRVEVVRFGIEAAAVPQRPGSAERPAGEQPGNRTETVVMCVGTLHEVKGQRYVIEAVARLVGAGEPVSLVLVGDGEDRHALERLARDLGVADRVSLLGALTHREVISRYRTADVVVAPSIASSDGRREGIPTVLMEAMAAGVPVVASDLTGIPELVEHERTGLLVEPGDSEGIAEAVIRLRTERGLAPRLAGAARQRVLDDYDIDRTAERMAGLMGRGASRRS